MSARGSIFGAANCPACGKGMTPDVILFCGKCWWKLPANERTALRAMHLREENTDSKIQKCVRILNGRAPTQAVRPLIAAPS